MAITERRLTAILAADVCDFSKMMGENEDRTIQNLRTCRELIEGSITSHNGNIFNTAGDSIVAEFGSVVDAVNCAVSFQETLRDRNDSVPEESKMEFRVGINLGDIIIEGDNRYGDGINIAARLEGLSEPGGICISGSVYSDIKSKLNLEFGAMGEQVLKNIAQPVSAYKIDFRGDDPVPMASIGDLDNTPITQPEQSPITVSKVSKTPKQTQSEKPSIAVLPFDNMSNDPEQEYFADGITEDLITALSRLRYLNVIARNTVSAYKGQSPDIIQVGKNLKVRYVVEGSIRRLGTRTRINIQLIDGQNGGHLWAEKFDRDIEDAFELQDEIVDSMFQALSPVLLQDEWARTVNAPIEDLNSMELAHRAVWHFMRHQKDDFSEAIKLADKSINLDSNTPIAWAVKGAAGASNEVLGFTNEKQDNISYVKKALSLSPSDPLSHAFLGHVYNNIGDDGNAIAAYREALSLNPNLILGLMGLGWTLIFSGSYVEGQKVLERAIKNSPRDPLMGRVYFALAASHFIQENNQEALTYINRSVEMNSQFPARIFQIIVYNEMGDINNSNKLLEGFRIDYPNVSVKKFNDNWLLRGIFRDRFNEGMIKVGLL